MLKMLLSECYASAHRKCFLPWDLSVTSPIFFVEDFIKYVAYLVCKILIFLLGMPPSEPTFLFCMMIFQAEDNLCLETSTHTSRKNLFLRRQKARSLISRSSAILVFSTVDKISRKPDPFPFIN